MGNYSVLDNNITQVSIYTEKNLQTMRTSMLILMLLFFCFFLYFMNILLSVYFTTAHVRDNARYILFAHMLISDTCYLLLGFFLMAFAIYVIYLPLLLCYMIRIATLTLFVVTPYNLAVMSLERYVAVCHPLRHAELCTVHKSISAIIVMWVLGLLPNVADMIVLMSSSIKLNTFLSLPVICRNEAVTKTPLQNTIKSLNIMISLSLVGFIIICTYIRVIMTAQKIDGSSASKAGKTVMLHAFQLLLCMTFLTSSFFETQYNQFDFLRITFFFLFMCLPRFLSPLIYGLRDELFRKYIKKMYSK
ncbi:odorant receptor 131-2-like [Mixophyes fleayi]|uniref:odorant receptor 131-2-like n=1 Tax=Mixophyes fleayi TaxID=3061075 RepID=UPI003F4E3534